MDLLRGKLPELLRFESLQSVRVLRSKSRASTIVAWPFVLLCGLWLLTPDAEVLLSIPKTVAYFFWSSSFVYVILRTFVAFRLNPPTVLTDVAYFVFDFLAIALAVSVTGGERSPFVVAFLISIVSSGLFFGLPGTVITSVATVIVLLIATYIPHAVANRPFHFWTVLFEGFFGLIVGAITSLVVEAERRERSLRMDAYRALADCLSGREKLLWKLVSEGKTNREIAIALDRDEKTVRNQLSGLYRKLGVGSRYELLETHSHLSVVEGPEEPSLV